MQVELGFRGVSINTLQIVKRVIRCSAFVCVCVFLFHVYVYMHVKKPPVAHCDEGTGGRGRAVREAWWRSLVVPLWLDQGF